MRKNSIKNVRINGEVLKSISSIIRDEVKDPRIHPMTSVMRVEVAPDLKTCKVWVSVLGDEEALTETVKALKAASGFIRRQLAHDVNLRQTPELFFLEDRSIEYGIRMSQKIEAVSRQDEDVRRLRGEDEEMIDDSEMIDDAQDGEEDDEYPEDPDDEEEMFDDPDDDEETSDDPDDDEETFDDPDDDEEMFDDPDDSGSDLTDD